MTGPRERRNYRPTAIFDVRDRYREQQVGDGLAATVTDPVVFAVDAVVTPGGRLEPTDWWLGTRRTMSGLSVFLDRVVEGGRGGVVRTVPPTLTSLELRVSSRRFQTRTVTFAPSADPWRRVDLFPAVDYPFAHVATRPDEYAPTLLRGSVLDEDDRGVPGAEVSVTQALSGYRTQPDGAFVVVLPDGLTWQPGPGGDELGVGVRVTLPATVEWQSATVLPGPGGASPWTQAGLTLTCSLTAVRGTTLSVPGLRLRRT
jgi:hypothetical protein